jgi:hypothetical protein
MYSADENSTGLMGSRRVRKRACATSGSVACYAESADGRAGEIVGRGGIDRSAGDAAANPFSDNVDLSPPQHKGPLAVAIFSGGPDLERLPLRSQLSRRDGRREPHC